MKTTILRNIVKKIKSGFKFSNAALVDDSSYINFKDLKMHNVESINIKKLNNEFKIYIHNKNWDKVFEYVNVYGTDILTAKYKLLDKRHFKILVFDFIKQYGPNINLNWLDVSNITDMSELFSVQLIETSATFEKSQVDIDMRKALRSFNGDISEWDVSNVTNMSYMFMHCAFNGDISKWNVSNVKSMKHMFLWSKFNGDISLWNVSNVTNMSHMFDSAEFNNDISNWDVWKVNDMSFMFGNSKFNQNISKWNVKHVVDISRMFLDSVFCQDISNWELNDKCFTFCMFNRCNTMPNEYKPKMLQKKINENTTSGFKFSSNNVNDSSYIDFEDSKIHNIETLNWTKLHNDFMESIKKGDKDKADEFLQIYGDILLYDFPFDCKVNTKEELRNIGKFFDDSKYDNYDLNYIDISFIADMSFMFNRLTYFNCKIDKWDVSHVINMSNMFGGYHTDEEYEPIEKHFNLPLNNWNVSNVKNMSCMFEGCTYFDLLLDNWNVSNVTHMEGMFKKCKNFNQNINNWDVSSVIDMTSMFEDCEMFNSPLNSWNVSNVRDMSIMFQGAVLFNQPLNKWNVSNVESMSYMFGVPDDNVGADVNTAYFNLNINGWDVSNVSDMVGMFINCRFFNLPLDKWANKLEKLENVAYMFSNCNSFCQDLSLWNIKMISLNKFDMFKGCDKLPRKFYPKGF